MTQFTEDDFDASFKKLLLIDSISEKIQAIYQLCANNYKNLANKCFQASEKIIKISLQAGYYQGQAYGNNLLGMIFINKSNFEQAIVSLSLALKIADNANIDDLKAKVLNNLGAVYEKLGDFDKAMIFYSDAYQSAERINNIKLMSALQSNMAVIYVHMKDYNNALRELKKIVDNKESNFPSDILLNVYFNICSCYRSKNELNEDLTLFKSLCFKRPDML